MLDPAVHAQLAAILPPAALLTTPEETRPYECDGLTLYRAIPAAVAIPDSEAQVVAILKRCHEAHVPVVARGAGTSLSGGAMPDRDGVVLSMTKFKRILAVDPLAQHRGRAARRAQCVDLRGGGPVRSLLRARPVLADHLHDRWQRRRECGRRALPQVRPHRAQRAARARRAHHRRDRRTRRRGARLARLRPARARQRFGRTARRHHRDHGEAHAEAAAGAGRACGLRRHRAGGGRRGGGDRHRHHSRGSRAHGPGGDARGRGVCPRQIPARREGRPAGRGRRHAGRSRGRDGRDHARC